jgi:hypothetical protein
MPRYSRNMSDIVSVFEDRGDRWVLQTNGKTAPWLSIIQTHRDGVDLFKKNGYNSVCHVGAPKYVSKCWKDLKAYRPKVIKRDNVRRVERSS